jgi:hypothetical protein
VTGKPSNIKNAREFSATTFGGSTAERAPLLAVLVALLDGREVRIIARALVGVAEPAESLELLGIIGPTLRLRVDVVHIQRPVVR